MCLMVALSGERRGGKKVQNITGDERQERIFLLRIRAHQLGTLLTASFIIQAISRTPTAATLGLKK